MGWNDKMRGEQCGQAVSGGEGDDCGREVFAKGNGP